MAPRAAVGAAVRLLALGWAVVGLLSGCRDTPGEPRRPEARERARATYSGVPLLASPMAAPALRSRPGAAPQASLGAGAGAARGTAVPLPARRGRTQASGWAAAGGALRHLMLENGATGDRVLWLSTGGVVSSAVAIGYVPPQWHVRGAGDLNGDGKTDLVWQDTVTGGIAFWYLDGAGGLSATVWVGVVPIEWSIAGAADYNGDGKDDILWWHRATGTVAFWYMDGNGGLLGSSAPFAVPAPWKPIAARDLNGDGRDDILWQNTMAGTTVLWTMSGAGTVAGSQALPAVPPAWSMVATADLDGDARQDILWQNESAGGLAAWYMDGAGGLSSLASLPPLPPGYRLAAGYEPLRAAAVARVLVTPGSRTLLVDVSVQLSAATLDSHDNPLSGRTITWSSSDPAVASVSAAGVVRAGGVGGPVTITARSEGQSGSATITVAAGVATGISDIQAFLEHCPTQDAAMAQIRQDFELRVDGQPVSATLSCTAPISLLPIGQLTDELIALQVLRTAYYMSRGTAGKLPWTPLALYDWLHANVKGVNIKTAAGQLYCCDMIDGKLYFSTSRQDDWQREFKRDWPGIASSLNFYVHEIRHADPGAPGHTNGCASFPKPTDPYGCDATYDLANLGSYGVQYWVESRWATGLLNIGVGCAPPQQAASYAQWDQDSANGFRSRFVSNSPPQVTATQPYGGPCVPR